MNVDFRSIDGTQVYEYDVIIWFCDIEFVVGGTVTLSSGFYRSKLLNVYIWLYNFSIGVKWREFRTFDIIKLLEIGATAQWKIMVAIVGHSTPDSRSVACRTPPLPPLNFDLLWPSVRKFGIKIDPLDTFLPTRYWPSFVIAFRYLLVRPAWCLLERPGTVSTASLTYEIRTWFRFEVINLWASILY